MCAAPGGKTVQLAQMMNNKGTMIALDNSTRRLTALKNNLERCGIRNTIIYNKDARYISDFNKRFDKILLDAPCSGNFTLEEDWFEKRTINDIKDRAKLQKELLKAAVDVCKGEIVYSTCSLEKEENEEVIEWALDNLNVELQEIKLKASPGLTERTKNCRRFWPNEHKTEGFFVAKLKVL